MAEHFGESSFPQFSAAIEQGREAPSVSPDTLDLMVAKARASIRYQGAFLTELVLNGPDGLVSPLYSDPAQSLNTTKLTASHAMLPVGPYEGAGGQHGFPRWSTYAQTERDAQAGVYDFVVLQAQTHDLPMSLERTYELKPGQLDVTTVVQNNSRFSRRTSIGEHHYFDLPGGPDSVEDVTIEGQSINDLLLSPDAVDKVQQGEAQFWPGFRGKADVAIPGIGTIQLRAGVEGASIQSGYVGSLGMLLWQRPGKSFVCLEPTIGVSRGEDGQFANTGLLVPAYGIVAVSNTINV